MVEQIFLFPKLNEACLLIKSPYIGVASQVAEQLKTYDLRKSENIRKYQTPIDYCLVLNPPP